jgi:hypothetical protein
MTKSEGTNPSLWTRGMIAVLAAQFRRKRSDAVDDRPLHDSGARRYSYFRDCRRVRGGAGARNREPVDTPVEANAWSSQSAVIDETRTCNGSARKANADQIAPAALLVTVWSRPARVVTDAAVSAGSPYRLAKEFGST